MTLSGFSEDTKKSYITGVKGLAKFYNRSSDLLTNEEVHLYIRHLIIERKVTWHTCNNYLSGIIYFYKNICYWEGVERFGIPPRPRQKTLPVALSIEEVKRLFSVITYLKHQVLLKTAYSAGLRVSELISLKPHHIESDPSRMLIRVEQGKGRKDRYTLLSKELFVTSQKNGASALGLKRVLGLGSYDTAWTWMHKLRRAMVRPGRGHLTGAVEVDETYVGGIGEKIRGRGTERKVIVAIAAEVKREKPRPNTNVYYSRCVGGQSS